MVERNIVVTEDYEIISARGGSTMAMVTVNSDTRMIFIHRIILMLLPQRLAVRRLGNHYAVTAPSILNGS